MENKQDLPTINIKGKQYVLVKDRILAFNELYPNGSITTELISPIDSKTVVIKATVIPDVKNPTRCFSDYSQAVIGQGTVNTTAAMENASTSACGRALAYLGIGVIESIASADEVIKATNIEDVNDEPFERVKVEDEPKVCSQHEEPIMMKKGTSKTTGKVYWYHRNEEGQICFGQGFK